MIIPKKGYEDLTRENCEPVKDFYHKTRVDSRLNPLHVRRTGKTIFWKTRPDNFRIPVKHGLRDHGYIDHANAMYWMIKTKEE